MLDNMLYKYFRIITECFYNLNTMNRHFTIRYKSVQLTNLKLKQISLLIVFLLQIVGNFLNYINIWQNINKIKSKINSLIYQ